MNFYQSSTIISNVNKCEIDEEKGRGDRNVAKKNKVRIKRFDPTKMNTAPCFMDGLSQSFATIL